MSGEGESGRVDTTAIQHIHEDIRTAWEQVTADPGLTWGEKDARLQGIKTAYTRLLSRYYDEVSIRDPYNFSLTRKRSGNEVDGADTGHGDQQ